MPQADASSSTSRRAVLSQLAVVPLLGSIPAFIPAAQALGEADATLLGHVARAIEAHRVMNDRAHKSNDEEYLALIDEFDSQLDDLAGIRAVTPAGLGAKACLIQLYLPSYFHAFEVDERSPEIRLLFSFIQDATFFAQRNAV
ncbi:hypothetical protein [Asaia spathodeae]|uniref:Twin-arginine translocation pathway signal n=1 Tax=Asaia spathodeae TaxID=657016 RepID=A0ABX2P452_9PROT|nr:hypothetical protein [Asaia spathodeae]GBR18545.1 hypothetical protein AA105894_2097 [Asaia spathodeae NBRC 105894]